MAATTKKLRVNVTVPEGFAPGDTFMIEVEVPAARPRMSVEKPITEMTKDELKREIINAGSVLYKAQKRGADAAIIEKNQQRLDAAKALMDEKFPKQVTVRNTSSGGTKVTVMQAEARVLTQDEIDHPEKYVTEDAPADDTANTGVDEETAAEL